MAQHWGPRPLRVALAVLLSPLAFCAAASLRQARRGRSADFIDLVECKVAYNRLEDQCSRGHLPPSAAGVPAYGGGAAADPSLVHDAHGSPSVNTRAPDQPAAYRRVTYRPPESRTGMPNGTSGWDYKLHGEDWQNLGECGGPNQSPVDLPRYVDVQGQTKSLLWFDYYVDPDLQPSKVAQLVNDGHGLRYDVPGNDVDLGFVKIGEAEYKASEYIFHAPSEHSLDGAVFPLELQIYHWSKEGKGGVAVGVFFREGPSNPFLAAVLASMQGTAPTWSLVNGSGVGSLLGRFPSAFDLEAVIPRGDAARERSFYNYLGSSTQPPCTTGVSWWVLSTPITATREEIRFVRRALYLSPSMRHGNARSSMPLGNRTVSSAIAGFQSAMKPGAVPFWSKLDEAKEPRGYNSGDIPWGEHWAPEQERPRSPPSVPEAAVSPQTAGPTPVSGDEPVPEELEEDQSAETEDRVAPEEEGPEPEEAGGDPSASEEEQPEPPETDDEVAAAPTLDALS